MSTLMVPALESRPLPTLGPQVCDFIEERAVFGPGSLKGEPARLDEEKRALIYRAYEVWPKGHHRVGRRRFSRGGMCLRKGSAKTELAAWIAYVELHPEAPVRCDGFDRWGRPVGRPVRNPYIPLVAYTQEQVADLVYAALFVVVTEGPDSGFFDAGIDRILRLDSRGRADGKAVPLSGSPNARDGALTTFQCFDETHRMVLPKQLAVHETMLGNLPKRPLEDPWSLEVTTAGEPGQGSVAEKTHREAEAIHRGEVARPSLFYFHREAGPGHDLSSLAGRIEAIRDASGPVAAWSDLEAIAEQWERLGADKAYLERVWLNRWTRSDAQAFDVRRFAELGRLGAKIPDGALVTAGFDGSRFRDATALVVTEVTTGLQVLAGLWERPDDDVEGWEVDDGEVSEVVEELMGRYEVWRLYADPPHWVETVGQWGGRWPDRVEEWWTHHRRPMAEAVRAYREAIASGQLCHNGDPDLVRHVGNAGRWETNLHDDDGRRLVILGKIAEHRKFDAAMAAVLSWRARIDALRAGATAMAEETFVPRRIR